MTAKKTKLDELEVRPLESELAATVISAVVSQGTVIDSFSTWLLGGTAGAAALVIVNIDKLAPKLSPVSLRLLLGTFCISIVFGLLQKWEALAFQMEAKLDEALEEKVMALAKAHGGAEVSDPYSYLRNKLDYVHTLAAVFKSFPRRLRKKALAHFSLPNANTRFERSQLRFLRYVRQARLLLGQLIFAVAAIPIVAFSI